MCTEGQRSLWSIWPLWEVLPCREAQRETKGGTSRPVSLLPGLDPEPFPFLVSCERLRGSRISNCARGLSYTPSSPPGGYRQEGSHEDNALCEHDIKGATAAASPSGARVLSLCPGHCSLWPGLRQGSTWVCIPPLPHGFKHTEHSTASTLPKGKLSRDLLPSLHDQEPSRGRHTKALGRYQ